MRASKETLLKSLDNEYRKLVTAKETIKEMRQEKDGSCFMTYAVEYCEQVQLAIKKMERLLEDYAKN